MTSTRTRTLAAAALVATLAVGATACGGGKSTGGQGQAEGGAPTKAAAGNPAPAQSPVDVTPVGFLQQVTKKTSEQKSAKITEEIKTQNGDITAAGPVSWASGMQGSMTIQMPMLAEKLGTDGAVDAVYLPDAMYMNMHMPQSMVDQMGGKHWFKYAYADLAKLMGPAGASLKNGLTNADPVTAVQNMIASNQVTKVGPDSVDGTPATHYTADLTLDQLSGQGSSLTPDQVSGLRQQLQSQGISKAHYDVWVSDQGLLLKQESKSETANGPIDMSATYSDYGVAVTAQAPAADDTLDFAQLIQQNGGLGGGLGSGLSGGPGGGSAAS
ncbi:hypothetical protein [Kitasatospora sp. LaBMicrA B282]|uniref:hypothetical protein n=1 Tax=Kitasatospora sp. LaBMicrA B282 TaxID=3420949 RepID=UPI003D0D900C